ncbi:MAG: hypothetical protein ACLT07_09925 [Clostridia bacterium]
MGSGKAKLDPIFYVLDHSDVPAKNLLPTHICAHQSSSTLA